MKCKASVEEKRQAIREYVNNIVDQEFYTVVFVKKTTGEVRKMQCRQHVQKYAKGGVNPCDGKPDLLPTYSMDAQGYRTVNLDGVIEIHHRKQVVKFGE